MTTAEFVQSELLRRAGFSHAFFTRNGGVSPDPYRSLSFSSAVGDDPSNVARNLARAAAALGVEPDRVHFLSQVHGRAVQVVDGSESREQVLQRQGDAVLSRAPNVACGVRSADCVPILLADLRSGAVAAIHAGWRGTVGGVVEAGVRALERLAGDAPELVAAIGPHISVDAFEVSEEIAAQLQLASPETDVVRRDRGPRPHVDLRRILRAQLRALAVPDASIDDVFGCTVGEPERFFSYRRDGRRSGRHLSAIVAR